MHQTQWSAERPLPPPVSLTSQSHHEKPPEVTCTSRGTPGCPASTRERPRETFFNTSRGQIPLLGLESKDALPLAFRMETRLPCRPTRGSLTSPSYLARNRTLGPPLENNPEPPPSWWCTAESASSAGIASRVRLIVRSVRIRMLWPFSSASTPSAHSDASLASIPSRPQASG